MQNVTLMSKRGPCREYEEAVRLTQDSKGALGIGLVGFSASSVFDEAIALKPGSIVSVQATDKCFAHHTV